ncbi:MAG: hypothetical protein ACR2QA_08610 [Solirubrobacteraceae bacterium]
MLEYEAFLITLTASDRGCGRALLEYGPDSLDEGNVERQETG